MNRYAKAALLGLGLTGAMLAGGCAAGYYDDDGYYHRDRSDSYYYDRNGERHWGGDREWNSRDRSWRDRDDTRVRVCDADGSDCHWEYRRR
jgi:hypothetical protein